MRESQHLRTSPRVAVVGGLAIALATVHAAAIEVITDIEYDSPGSGATCLVIPECNRLDLYLPDGSIGAGVPTIMFIHGGAWEWGDKAWQFPGGMTILAEAGYPGVSCNYTLATWDAPSYPQAVHDVKAVVRWIRTVGVETYGLPMEIVVVGPSAGGHLTNMVGVTAGVDIFEPLPAPPGPYGYRVNGMVPLWGESDFTTAGDWADYWLEQFLGVPWSEPLPPVYIEASPLTWVDGTDVSAWFFHGRLDEQIPWEQSQVMHEALLACDVASQITIDDERGHGIAAWGGDEAVAQMLLELDVIPVVLTNNHEPADLDRDGFVGFGDLLTVLAAWGPCAPPPCCVFDLDGDSVVGFSDLLTVLSAWGQ